MTTVVAGPPKNTNSTTYPTRVPPVKTNSEDESLNVETDATYDYYAFSSPGASTASAVWKVFRINRTTLVKQYADGNANYDNVGSSMSGLSYS